MLHAVTARILAVATCAWLLAGEADALTLGRARGAALIGRPVEITVPVTLDGQGSESPCPGAELFYGDRKVSAPSVRWEASAPGEGVVRVTSSVPVDEPMLTLYLRIGCGQASTRRFVLLSELPPEDEPAARSAPSRLPAVAAPPAAAARPQAAAAASPRRREVAATAPAVAPPAAQRPPSVSARAPARASAPAPRPRREAAAPQPRLRLEPLEVGPERDPTLRISTELVMQAAIDPAKRAALAALWQALQRAPEQGVEDAIRLQGLERELGAVRESTRQNAAAVASMRTQVEQARGDRNLAAALVIALALVLAALAGWIAWRWHRVRELERVGRWFEANGESAQAGIPTAPHAPVAVEPAVPALVAAAATGAIAAAAARDTAKAAPAPATASGWGATSEFQASRGGTLRMVGVQELIDVHDKADFFLSIGETEQALAVLEAHVHDQVETGALAWLDLLELYHALGRRAEFERLRSEFRQRFTAQVPDFEHYDQPSASLESYSRALSRIVALWPSPKVLEVIEESIFRKPGGVGAEPFTLEAYRELVLLYHVAKDMAPQEQGLAKAGAATTFADTSLQPLNMVERPEEPALSEHERLMVPPASARLGVDIDLDASDAAPSERAPLDFDISTFDPAGLRDDERG